MRSTLTAFLGACLLLLSACGGSTANEEGTPASAAAEDPGTAFHGAWELASIVRYSPDGEELSRNEESTGFIMYDPAGAMGVVIQGADRQTGTAGVRATPEERLAAYRSYTAYFGAFTVDPEAGAVTHHLRASMNPNAAGSDYVRNYEFADDRLTLQPPAGADGGTVRLTWRKLPDLAELTDEHRRFIGFWHFDRLERRDEAGEAETVERTFEDGFIIYTASGHMAVHLVRPERQPFAGPRPTAEEAASAIGTYISYFGPYTIHADDGYIVTTGWAAGTRAA